MTELFDLSWKTRLKKKKKRKDESHENLSDLFLSAAAGTLSSDAGKQHL